MGGDSGNGSTTIFIIDDADSEVTSDRLSRCLADGNIRHHLEQSFTERIQVITRSELSNSLRRMNSSEKCIVIANKGIDTVTGIVQAAGAKVKRILWLTYDNDSIQQQDSEGGESGEEINVDRITPSNFSEMVGYYLGK